MSGGSERSASLPGEVRFARAADGARIAYEVVGEGPPLVMLHGFLANRFTFSRQRAVFAARFRLILVGFRGSAGSDATLPAEFGIGTSEVDDLRAVLDAEKLDRVSLFAHSSGGATGFVLATQAPERVARAVFIEPTLYALLPPAARARISAENAAVVAVARAQGPEGGAEAALRRCLAMVGGDAWARLDAPTQDARLRGLAESAAFVGPHTAGLENLVVTDDDVIRLRPPSLLLYGADSFWFEALIAERWRALRPDLRVLTVPGAAHNVHREAAETVNAEALGFLVAA